MKAFRRGVENRLLTPTMKLKRKPILERYADEIKSIYGNRRMG